MSPLRPSVSGQDRGGLLCAFHTTKVLGALASAPTNATSASNYYRQLPRDLSSTQAAAVTPAIMAVTPAMAMTATMTAVTADALSEPSCRSPPRRTSGSATVQMVTVTVTAMVAVVGCYKPAIFFAGIRL